MTSQVYEAYDPLLIPWTSPPLISVDRYRKSVVSVGLVVVGGAVTLLCFYYGYRLANTVRLYHLLSGVTPDSSPPIVDGTPVAIEGTVAVDEEAAVSDRATDGQAPPTAMYVWRAAFPRSGQMLVDLKNRETEQAKATFASGIEFGSFTIATESGDVQIDPSWLRDVHDATRLEAVRPVGFLPSRTWHVYLWRSPYVQLSNHLAEMPLERLRSAIDNDPDIDLNNDYFMSKGVPEGTQLAVHGELSVKGGTPTIEGTDDTPFFVSDGGIGAIHSNLRRRALKYGAFLVLALAANTIAIFAFS